MKPAPIHPGELYLGTHLRRRYQLGTERCPEYQGPEQTTGARFDNAIKQLATTGHRAFYDALTATTYAAFGGEWYALSNLAKGGAQ